MISPPEGAARNISMADLARFWKGNPYFIIVMHCNYTSVVHRFRFNELFMFAGNDVIAIWLVGGASGHFWLRILEGRRRLYIVFNWDFMSILNYLERFRRYSNFFFNWDFPTGGESLGVLEQNDPQNVKLDKKSCWLGTSLRQTASFQPSCVKLSLCLWP